MPKSKGISARLLSVIDKFTIDQPVWTAEGLSEALDYALPTCYRYLRDLADAGFVQRLTGGRYALGYRIVALDRVIRHSDPVLRVAAPVLREMATRFHADAMLSTIYGDEIWTTHHEIGGAKPMANIDGRGAKRPLFRGAASKVILAHLPTAKLRTLYDSDPKAAKAAGLGDNWAAFKRHMSAIRKRGYHISIGEIRPENSSLAVAICTPDRSEVRAIQIVVSVQQFELLDKTVLATLVKQAAEQITTKLNIPTT